MGLSIGETTLRMVTWANDAIATDRLASPTCSPWISPAVEHPARMELGRRAATSPTAASVSRDARPPNITASVDGESMPAGQGADQPDSGRQARVCSNIMNRLRFL